MAAAIRWGCASERMAENRQIVGYVRDAVYESLRDAVPAHVLPAVRTGGGSCPSVDIDQRARGRIAGAADAAGQAARGGARQVHGDIRITFRPLADHVDAALTQERIVAALSAFFGALALLLAGLGLYGIASYAVNRRRTEIAIRMALGAAPGGVVTLVLRRADDAHRHRHHRRRGRRACGRRGSCPRCSSAFSRAIP